MTFTTGAFLFGALLGLIPIIIHLIYRRQSRIVEFPSLMFFRFISKRVSRRQNIREWIILLLRFLIIVFIAVALANPIITMLGYIGGSSSSVVILIDDSYSMQVEIEGESILERARRKAFDILMTLDAGDDAAVIKFSDILSNTEIPSLTFDIDSLQEKILESDTSNSSATLYPAYKKAMNLLSKSTMPNKECYIISDFRVPVLRDFKKLTETNSEIAVYHVSLGAAEFPSFAIQNIEKFDSRLIKNSKTKIRVDVVNLSGLETQIVVELNVQTSEIEENEVKYSENPDRQTIVFKLNETEKSVYFEITATDEDVVSGYVQLVLPDKNMQTDLAVDNRRYFAIEISDKEPVLVVNGEPNNISFDNEVHYLLAALLHGDSDSYYEPVEILTDDLNFNNFTDYRAIFLCNVALQNFSNIESDYTNLLNYVEEGGILVIFPGDRIDAKSYNDFFKRNTPENSMLPAGFIAINNQYSQNDEITLKKISTKINLLKNLDELDASIITFTNYWKLDVQEQDVETEKIAELSNNDVFLAAKTTGIGKVYLFSVPADREWSNLPPRKLFPILIHRILDVKMDGFNNISPLETFEYKLPQKLGKSQVLVILPANAENTDSIAKDRKIYAATSGGEKNIARFPVLENFNKANTTKNPGVYFYKINPSESASKFSAFCINPDSVEADAQIIQPGVLIQEFPNSQIISKDTDIGEFIRKRREGSSIWLVFAMLCLLAFICESILANHKLPGLKNDESSTTVDRLKEESPIQLKEKV